MQSVASILDRFRRAGGVPAAAVDDTAAELTPVFAALEEIEAEARAVGDAAARDAEQALGEAEMRRAEILASWRKRAEGELARVESEWERASAARAAAVESEAREQAQLLRERGRGRIPALVEDVVACVRAAAQ